MTWKTRLALGLLALGTLGGFGSALARGRHCRAEHRAHHHAQYDASHHGCECPSKAAHSAPVDQAPTNP